MKTTGQLANCLPAARDRQAGRWLRDPSDIRERLGRAFLCQEYVAQQDQLRELLRLVERLPDDQRRVITLWYKEHSFEEIGHMMDRSPNAARMLWMRAIERLQLSVARQANELDEG